MNKRQKIVQAQFLNDEEAVIKRLKTVYNKSLEDINGKVKQLDSSIAMLQKAYESIDGDEIGDLAASVLGKKVNAMTPAEAQETIKSMLQSKVYQKQYQTALKKQVDTIYDKMQADEYKTVAEYLDKCYENGFIGTMYDLNGQGIPLCFPLDQEAMVRAVQLDSKISQGLYERLGEDVALLKKKITAQVSRGIATGMSYQQVAQQLAGYTKIGFNNAVRIARTEGHRIQCQSGMDACYKAQEKGADVLKQWDAALDARTRESHAKVDGEVRELDERFSNGLSFPGDPHGGAAEVVNCRCALLQRARWALEGGISKMNNFTKEIESFESPEKYAEFKEAFFSRENRNYMNYVETLEEKYGTRNFEKLLDSMNEREYNHLTKLAAKNPLYNKAKVNNSATNEEPKRDIIKPNLDDKYMKALDEGLKRSNVEYRKVEKHDIPLSEEEIIQVLAGGDMTKGSCASLGLAYAGQKGGLNVLDFRDGESRKFFATTGWLETIKNIPGAKSITETAKAAVTAGNKLLKKVEIGKEYYFVSGKHAAIVRKTDDGILQYLELQSKDKSGWQNFDGNPRHTLSWRFGDYRLGGFDVESFMIEVDSIKDSDDLRYLLGYINTSPDKQRKGKHGTIK